jgi:RNA polymerase sigma-70 factor (ECF subfamily)
MFAVATHLPAFDDSIGEGSKKEDAMDQNTPYNPDADIIALFWARDEQALQMTDRKYRSYLFAVAHHILGDDADAQECVNDAYLHAWNTIPPARPRVLAAYLVTIARRRALDLYRHKHRQKRGGGLHESFPEEYPLSDGYTVQQEEQSRRIAAAIDQLMEALPSTQRYLFVGRYYLHRPVSELARALGLSRSAVQKQLASMKKKLRILLESEDITV